jgi:diguanylate cyclase (GGDEF)-like protein
VPNEWVVVLELARPANAQAIEKARVEEVLVAMTDATPAALIAPDRCALQLYVVADGPAEAMLVGLSRWRDTAGRLCLPCWELARAEVMVPAELDREFEVAGSSPARLPQIGNAEGQALLEVAFRDPLTGVVTQALFTDCLERALAQGAAVGRVHALLLVELDSLDAARTGQPPPSTDRTLNAAAPYLVASVREADVIARLIGDQFAVLLRNVTPEAAEVVARRIVEQVQVPVSVADTHITVRATVGLALSHAHQTCNQLLDAAAAALLIAKRRGGNTSASFTARSLVPGVADLHFDHCEPRPHTGP